MCNRWQNREGLTVCVAAGVLLGIAVGQGQRGSRVEMTGPAGAPSSEFHFIRLEYTDLPQYHRRFGFSSRDGRGSGWWMMDWPDADEHFTEGVRRLTRLNVGEPRHLGLLDPRLFEYPWIYATQVGWWDLSDAEVVKLREYLMRGGFFVVDDFYEGEQWEVFRRTMQRVLPGRTITEIPESDSMMHVLYDIEDKHRTFIPGTRHLRRGADGKLAIQQPPGIEPSWRGMYDDRNRLVVAINFNMDMADAWEYADHPEYPEAKTTLAYRFGINYILYALTH
ncbi:MAG TPA: DUF4159 domain-containing protein [Bryobacteraceae bacterium]|nr:DUF4159 domain-containing protein [Bryobacteraceae bacterium]